MPVVDLNGLRVHYREDGNSTGSTLVFGNSLGTDFRIWDQVVDLLPKSLRIIRYDKRGHGLTDCPDAPYSMGSLITDAERLLDHLNVKDCVFVGLSIGGLIAQGLAVKRLDQIRALVLSNTAAKIGNADIWQERIDMVHAQGLPAMAPTILERWFSKPFRQTVDVAPWANMLARSPAQGYAGCSAAIAGADFITPTSGLRLPTLAIAGDKDGATPPDLVRETADLIPGSRFHLIKGAGHIPCVENPDKYAATLLDFMKEIGHV